MELKPKEEKDIVVVAVNDTDSAAILHDARLVEDIKLVAKYAEENNIKYYLGVKEDDGKQTYYILNDKNEPIVVEEGTFGENKKYVEPVVEDPVEELEDVEKDVVKDVTEDVVSEKEDLEDNQDVSEEDDDSVEIEEDVEKLEQYDAELTRLHNIIKSQEDKISELTDENESLKLQRIPIPVEVKNEITLEDVIDFMKNTGIKTLSI